MKASGGVFLQIDVFFTSALAGGELIVKISIVLKNCKVHILLSNGTVIFLNLPAM
jgi:hypothetical protein